MRVLHVSEVAIGGVAALIRDFAAAQVRRGHEPFVLCPSAVGTDPVRHEAWRVRRRQPASYPAAIEQLTRAVRRTRPDIVHLHSFFAGFLGRLVPGLQSSGAAVVYQPHSWNQVAAPNAAARGLISAWEWLAALRTDAIVVNCMDEASEGSRHGIRRPIHVVGLPVDPLYFFPADPMDRAGQRRLLGLDDRRVVLCLGALCWQKGQDRLVAEWERDPPPDAVLTLLGGSGGPYLKRQGVDVLRALAPREWGRSILAVGHQDDVRPWLAAAEVMVLPSRYEGMSVAVAESLCAGVPVVMFDVNGAREAVLDGPEGAAGAVVEQGRTDALLEELRRRLGGPDLVRRESEVARQRGLRMFAPDAVAERLEDAYRAAITRRGR